MNIYKVLPDLSSERQLKLWHKALRSQWSAEDLDWRLPKRLTGKRTLDGLARILTPLLMGEQSALYSVASLIPILGHRSEVDSQFFLTTWAVDEARHTELFARFYGRLDREPMSIRGFPSGYLFQKAINSQDPGIWLSGVLVSEVAARLFMQELLRLDVDPVLSLISEGILEDEARHLAFNHVYLEEEFARLCRRDEADAAGYGETLSRRLETVLRQIVPVFSALQTDLRDIGVDGQQVFDELSRETRERLFAAIERGRKVAAREADGSRLAAAAEAR